MNIKGKLLSVNFEVYGKENKEKATLIIKTDGQYPKEVCLQKFLKDTEIGFYKNLKVGSEIDVYFNPESREYNGKWYTSLNIWKIDLGENKTIEKNNTPPTTDELPF